MDNIWQLQEAKSKFSELVSRALSDGAQIITRHGKNAVVVISIEEYENLTHPAGSLSQFLLSSPLAQAEIVVDRDKTTPRDLEIEP